MPFELKKKYSIVYEMSLDDMCHAQQLITWSNVYASCNGCQSRLDFDFCGCKEVPSSSFTRINYQSNSKYITY